MKTKKFQQIALPLTGILLFSLSSCVIGCGAAGEDNSRPSVAADESFSHGYPPYYIPSPSSSSIVNQRPSIESSVREVNYNLVSITREGMEEMYASFFQATFDYNAMEVITDDSEGRRWDEMISATTSRREEQERTSECEVCGSYGYSLVSEDWSFIDEKGRKIFAHTIVTPFNEPNINYYSVGEEAYQSTFKMYRSDINLPGYLENISTVTDETYGVSIPNPLENAVFATSLSESEDGYRDILLTVTVKDENDEDLEIVRLEAFAMDGLVKQVSYSSMCLSTTIYPDGTVTQRFCSPETHVLRFAYYRDIIFELPDLTGWEDITGMMD